MLLGGLCQCMHVVAEFSIGNFFVLIKLLLYPSDINMRFPFLEKNFLFIFWDTNAHKQTFNGRLM